MPLVDFFRNFDSLNGSHRLTYFYRACWRCWAAHIELIKMVLCGIVWSCWRKLSNWKSILSSSFLWVLGITSPNVGYNDEINKYTSLRNHVVWAFMYKYQYSNWRTWKMMKFKKGMRMLLYTSPTWKRRNVSNAFSKLKRDFWLTRSPLVCDAPIRYVKFPP